MQGQGQHQRQQLASCRPCKLQALQAASCKPAGLPCPPATTAAFGTSGATGQPPTGRTQSRRRHRWQGRCSACACVKETEDVAEQISGIDRKVAALHVPVHQGKQKEKRRRWAGRSEVEGDIASAAGHTGMQGSLLCMRLRRRNRETAAKDRQVGGQGSLTR